MESRDRNLQPESVGQSAETVACAWLSRRGLQPLARNFRSRFGEIDLVMLDRNTLVFVEVRCRIGRSPTTAAATVRRGKQQRLIRTALMFVSAYPHYANHTMRFDIVGFDRTPDASGPDDWIRNAFDAETGVFQRS